MKEGIYPDMTAADYHRDPACEPSLSSSIAKVLVSETPRHARLRHPRLTSLEPGDPDRKMEIGSVAHALLLGKGQTITVIDAASYQAKKARDERAEAYIRGEQPILASDCAAANLMAEEMKAKIGRSEIARYFANSQKECVFIRQEEKIWLRSMMDAVNLPAGVIFDYKTTTSIGKIENLIASSGYELQAAFYIEMAEHFNIAQHGLFEFYWLFQEQTPPYDCRIVRPSGIVLQAGRILLKRAKILWREAMLTGRWPGYPDEITYADYPAWKMKELEES